MAITADISNMYRAMHLASEDKDFHRFVWRSTSTDPVRDFRMTRVTFGVSASSFAADMAIKQNALDFEHMFPLASKVVEENIYVDDCLAGAHDIDGALALYHQLLKLFGRGGFMLRIRYFFEVLNTSGNEGYAKTLGLEWNTTHDFFRLTISDMQTPDILTKRILVSNVAKLFDVLGWFWPTVIKMKVLLQQLLEAKIDWDDSVPDIVKGAWIKWNTELQLLSSCHIPHYLFPKNFTAHNIQLHGFSDASEEEYGGVVYIRGEDSNGNTHVQLIAAKTKVAPLKRLTIRLELCGAYLLTQLLEHYQG